MKTIVLSGIINFDSDDGETIYLLNGKQHKINLVDAFEEEVAENGNEVQLNYWISNKPCAKEQMLEGWLKKLYGIIETDCDEIFQGSWTFENASTVGYDKYYKLQIGGHNLFDELREQDGKFIILELNFDKED
jgi:hypothetical protein